MAIKLQIYLKRTQQSLEEWLRANEISKSSELLPRCAYLGLGADAADVALVEQVLKRASVPVVPVVPVVQESKPDPDEVEKKPKKKKVDAE